MKELISKADSQNFNAFGRMLFGLIFVVFGVNHFLLMSVLVGVVPSYFPAPQFWVALTGVVFIVAGLGIAANKMHTRTLALVLAAQLAVLVLLVQLPGLPGTMPQFLKDLGLFAAALMVAHHSKNS